ncbi:MAG: hypothetical protein PHW46_04315, partial [Candidatus Omnitrophica bacterium]|nr:hypothetical protein [Candidatus Omnitrophota bacterium]
ELKEIPAVSFSYFNPNSKKYGTFTKGPFPVAVLKKPETESTVKMVSLPGAEEIFYPQEKIGQDILFIKENPGTLTEKNTVFYQSKIFWGMQAMILFLFEIFSATYRRKERILKDASYARYLKAPRRAKGGLKTAKAHLDKGEIVLFYDTIFKMLQEYLSGRLNLPKGNVTVHVIEEKIGAVNHNKEILQDVSDVFAKCEMARYAPSAAGKKEAEEVFEKVRKIIDYMEKVRV